MKHTLLPRLTSVPCSVGLAILLRVNIWLAAALQEEEAAEQEVSAILNPVAVCSGSVQSCVLGSCDPGNLRHSGQGGRHGSCHSLACSACKA